MAGRQRMCSVASLLFAAVVFPIFGESRNLIVIARCDSLCLQDGKDCKEKCYSNPPEKPGQCGNQNYTFYNICIHECDSHNDCFNMELCCSQKCGKTCQNPVGLESIKGLPEIPTNVTISKSQELNCMLVDWTHQGEALFVVEMQEASGIWQTAHKTPRSSHPMKIHIQSGVEYVVRVAAVNSLGSKGFSQQSNPFILYFEPKPPDIPENLSFKGSLKNGSVSGILSWQVPHSDQHISRLLVTWSKRIADESTPPHKGAKEVHRKNIPHGKNCIRIKNLLPNTHYTFHVQAIVMHEKKKLSSKRATLHINTTSYTSNVKRRGRKKSKQKLSAQYNILHTNKGLSAEISWKSRNETKYGISWESVCGKTKLRINKKNKEITSPYVIPSLEKNCEYNVVIKEINECKKQRRVGKVTFRTD